MKIGNCFFLVNSDLRKSSVTFIAVRAAGIADEVVLMFAFDERVITSVFNSWLNSRIIILECLIRDTKTTTSGMFTQEIVKLRILRLNGCLYRKTEHPIRFVIN